MSKLNYQILYSCALELLLEIQASGNVNGKVGRFKPVGDFENSMSELFRMTVLVQTVVGHSQLKSKIGRLIDREQLKVAAISAIDAIQTEESKPKCGVVIQFPVQIFHDYAGSTYLLSITIQEYASSEGRNIFESDLGKDVQLDLGYYYCLKTSA